MQDSTGFAPSPEGRGGSPDLFNLLAWAGRDPGLTPLNKAVLLAVVAHADEHGVCTASDQALATASHTSIQTVQRALHLFQGHRVLQRTRNPPRNRPRRLLPRERPADGRRERSGQWR